MTARIPRGPGRLFGQRFLIGGADDTYLVRWYVIPHNQLFNVYLHLFLRSDDDRALHDHPWWNLSLLLRGGYLEHLPGEVVKLRQPFRPVLRRAASAHRVELMQDGKGGLLPAWSLFFTGPKLREWGFLCPKGWVHWRAFTNPADNGATVGRGCE